MTNCDREGEDNDDLNTSPAVCKKSSETLETTLVLLTLLRAVIKPQQTSPNYPDNPQKRFNHLKLP